MPIDESYKSKDLQKLLDFKAYVEPIVKEEIENADEDDLEFGYSFEKDLNEELYVNAVEQNNYYDVKTEVLEHHDGVYLKSTFVNSIENITAERYVNIRSNAKIEISYRCFIDIDNIKAIIEKSKDTFKITLKSG
ncbi:hypothetical protein [Hydrogenobaculum sp.]|nr:MAG: hypothetical protein C0170_00930 [Hydrogenobaculum sp.]HEK24912.1 hypothetical protein [Hydrogenobaculum sp.]